MYKKITLSVFLFCTTLFHAQVGIGTTDPAPGAILDIDSDNSGIVIPRVALTATTNQAPIAAPTPEIGLMVFNIATAGTPPNNVTPGFYYWAGTSWERIANTSSSNQSIKYSNTNTTTNVNQATAINLPVVSTLEWNDNPTLYIPNTTTNSIQVTQTGRYNIIANVSLASGVQRVAPEIRIVVNGTPLGSYGSTGYIRNFGSPSIHVVSSLHLNETLNLNANDVISIQIQQNAATGIATLRSAGTSNLLINRIK